MNRYDVVEVQYGSEAYAQTVELRNKVMRIPLGLSIHNDDLSHERDAMILAIFEANQILGTGILTFEEDVIAKIRFLCVDNQLQSNGIGSVLLEALEKCAIEQGIEKIILDARVSASNFYHKFGYKESGKVFIMETAPVDHICMEKFLMRE